MDILGPSVKEVRIFWVCVYTSQIKKGVNRLLWSSLLRARTGTSPLLPPVKLPSGASGGILELGSASEMNPSPDMVTEQTSLYPVEIHSHEIHSITISGVDECGSNPCQHGGTCIDEHLSYTCTCVDGYTGTVCETGEHFYWCVYTFQTKKAPISHFGPPFYEQEKVHLPFRHQ